MDKDSLKDYIDLLKCFLLILAFAVMGAVWLVCCFLYQDWAYNL